MGNQHAKRVGHQDFKIKSTNVPDSTFDCKHNHQTTDVISYCLYKFTGSITAVDDEGNVLFDIRMVNGKVIPIKKRKRTLKHLMQVIRRISETENDSLQKTPC